MASLFYVFSVLQKVDKLVVYETDVLCLMVEPTVWFSEIYRWEVSDCFLTSCCFLSYSKLFFSLLLVSRDIEVFLEVESALQLVFVSNFIWLLWILVLLVLFIVEFLSQLLLVLKSIVASLGSFFVSNLKEYGFLFICEFILFKIMMSFYMEAYKYLIIMLLFITPLIQLSSKQDTINLLLRSQQILFRFNSEFNNFYELKNKFSLKI